VLEADAAAALLQDEMGEKQMRVCKRRVAMGLVEEDNEYLDEIQPHILVVFAFSLFFTRYLVYIGHIFNTNESILCVSFI
jgi:hypothetical protein